MVIQRTNMNTKYQDRSPWCIYVINITSWDEPKIPMYYYNKYPKTMLPIFIKNPVCVFLYTFASVPLLEAHI